MMSPALALSAVLSLSLLACGESERKQAPSGFGGSLNTGGISTSGGSSQAGGSSSGGAASGGASGSANTSGGTSTGATGGSGGSSAVGGAGGEGGVVEIQPLDEACLTPTAFAPDSLAFIPGTSEPLAAELNRMAYSNPDMLTLVAMVKSREAGGELFMSFTDASGGDRVFPNGFKPTASNIVLQYGGFSSTTVASAGWLLVNDGEERQIQLTNLSFSGSTLDGCTRVMGVFIATIPSSEGSKSLNTSSGVKTISELGGAEPWQIKALLQASSTSFDFASANQ